MLCVSPHFFLCLSLFFLASLKAFHSISILSSHNSFSFAKTRGVYVSNVCIEHNTKYQRTLNTRNRTEGGTVSSIKPLGLATLISLRGSALFHQKTSFNPKRLLVQQDGGRRAWRGKTSSMSYCGSLKKTGVWVRKCGE